MVYAKVLFPLHPLDVDIPLCETGGNGPINLVMFQPDGIRSFENTQLR